MLQTKISFVIEEGGPPLLPAPVVGSRKKTWGDLIIFPDLMRHGEV